MTDNLECDASTKNSMDILQTIKRAVRRGNTIFTLKAEMELEQDGLTEDMVVEAIVNARGIQKRLRSTVRHYGPREYLYVIISTSLDGTAIYTKGKLAKQESGETFYVLISSKKSTD